MARSRRTYERKPGIMDRLRKRPPPHDSKVTTKHSKNPITGTETTTHTTKTEGHHGNTHHTNGTAHHHHRKPTAGDKISGAMMKVKGSITKKPGVKVSSQSPGRES